MTSMEAESVTTILCTSKQTRFNIAVPNYREVSELLTLSFPRKPACLDCEHQIYRYEQD